jgi:hypothetical protein
MYSNCSKIMLFPPSFFSYLYYIKNSPLTKRKSNAVLYRLSVRGLSFCVDSVDIAIIVFLGGGGGGFWVGGGVALCLESV